MQKEKQRERERRDEKTEREFAPSLSFDAVSLSSRDESFNEVFIRRTNGSGEYISDIAVSPLTLLFLLL